MYENQVWYGRKRTFLGLPLSFTKYYLTDEKLIVKTGFFSSREEEIRLYRILDLTLNRSLGEKMFGLGSIHVCSADHSTPELTIMHIKNSPSVKNMLSDMVEAQRTKKRVSSREFMGDDNDDMFDRDPHN